MRADTAIRILLNGEPVVVPGTFTVREVLLEAGIDPDQPGIAVARNAQVVHHSEWPRERVEECDELEVITAFQGG